jgi:hypothetical protein
VVLTVDDSATLELVMLVTVVLSVDDVSMLDEPVALVTAALVVFDPETSETTPAIAPTTTITVTNTTTDRVAPLAS